MLIHWNRYQAVVVLILAAIVVGGCGRAPAPVPLVPLAVQADAVETGEFEDLRIVLAAAVDDEGRVRPTALAVHLPRLGRQLARLVQPWPADAVKVATNTRLVWLYNARMAWSLRLVADRLQPAGLRGDRWVLPASMPIGALRDRPFRLDGGRTTLAAIDEELARWNDYRVAVSAPGVTDLAGPLANEPFDRKTVRARVAERFRAYMTDPDRVVLDHAAHRLRVPPALARKAERVAADFNRRYGTADALLSTALREHLDVRGRRRMESALGYPAVERDGPAGIVTADQAELGRRLVASE